MRTIHRREFLKSASTAAAAASAFTILPRHVLGASGGRPGPNDRVNVAGIGVGGMGASNLEALEGENIVALCDVDSEYAAKTLAKYPNARRHVDYRRMLESQADIDAVVIATPDHTHAVITLAALRAGKHVYCQKPLTRTVREARVVASEAAKYPKLVTQMGNQGRSQVGSKLLSRWIYDGAIGPVREVHAWCSLSYYPWGHEYWSPACSRRPADTPAVPATLDWDLWLGPAAARPYHRCYHPGCWRAWWDFGTAMMTDRGVHTLGPVCWALDLVHPRTVSANSIDVNDDTYPIASVVTFDFDARGSKPPVKLVWFEGLEPPRPDALEDGRVLPAEGGAIFYGATGTIVAGVYGEAPRLIPESAMADAPKYDAAEFGASGTHEMDWINAIKEGRRASSDFSLSGPLTEFVLLGNVAKKFTKRLAWDPANLKIANEPAADAMLYERYREGWTL